MVAIEHHQKSAIIATTATTSATTNLSTATTPTTTRPITLDSDIANSNVIAVLSPTSSASSTASTTTATTATATSSIIALRPEDSKEAQKIEDLTSITANKVFETMSQSSSEASTATAESAASKQQQQQAKQLACENIEAVVSKSAVSQRNIDIKIAKKSNKDAVSQELTKKVLKLDLTGKDLDDYSIRSPKSPIATRLPHQSSLTTVDVEDRKTLREALYQGIFHRHRRTIFAVGSFLRMLRSRNSSYNTIRSSSEGEDIDEVR